MKTPADNTFAAVIEQTANAADRRVPLIPWDKLTSFFGKHLGSASA